MSTGTAIVVGVGSKSGLGAELARKFSREGLRVVIVGRTETRLEAVAEDIRQAGGNVIVKVADASIESDVVELFDASAIENDLDLVVFNAGSNITSPGLGTTVELFENMWRQIALGGFLVGREAVHRLLPFGKGTILFTGATASLRSRPPFLAFSSAKFSLRATAQCFAREFGPQGIHVAHIVIDGVIDGEYASLKFPDLFAEKQKAGRLQLESIADTFWAIHKQEASAWTHELDLRPFRESF